MSASSTLPVIAVFGATGLQGGGVVRALQQLGGFRVRALTRNPDAHAQLADEVVHADLNRLETLAPALEGAYGVFLVTNFWEPGTDELSQGRAAVQAAQDAGVAHFVWSTLPDVDAISGGRLSVPHFTQKARVDELVRGGGFPHTTFVQAPFYFQNLTGMLGPRDLEDGQRGWVMPLGEDERVVHMGDITELGRVVAGAFADPDGTGNGEVLSMAAGLYSFGDVRRAFEALGQEVVYRQVPFDVYAGFHPGAEEMAQMMKFWQTYSYMGPGAERRVARAREVATGPLTELEDFLGANGGAA